MKKIKKNKKMKKIKKIKKILNNLRTATAIDHCRRQIYYLSKEPDSNKSSRILARTCLVYKAEVSCRP